MMKKTILMAFLWCFLAVCSQAGNVHVTHLRVDMKENPVGIDALQPRFGWQLAADGEYGVKQLAYRIEVARSPKDLKKHRNLVWDSGVVYSDNTLFIPYEGEPLQSRQTYYWRVRLQTNRGTTGWSDVQQWSMALLNASDWDAMWIGENALSNPGETKDGDTRLAARYLRKEFVNEKKVAQAVLYISGLGAYKAHINGQQVGDELLTPAVSQYDKTVYYNVYDVTSLLERGGNTLGVILGNGRYFCMRNPGQTYFDLPCLLAQLEITYSDGSKQTIVSDTSWKVTSKGPIVANNEYDGEEYDARLDLGAWSLPGYDDSRWKTADVMTAPKGVLHAQPNPSIRVMERISPVRIWKTGEQRYMVDMGQNMVGRLQATLQGKSGKKVSMRFAELMNPDETLYTANLRTAKATDYYVPAVDGTFTWAPLFVFHGFRYVEITGIESQPGIDDLIGEVMYDDMETVGTFHTSNEMINKIYRNAYWGIRGNYRSMPTDCPQRDERMGWLGDRATGCYGENYLFDNGLLYSKWLQDIEDTQNADGIISVVAPSYWGIYSDDVTWPSAYINSAHMLYRHYGDPSGIIRHYDSFKRYIKRVQTACMENGLVVKDTYGDWCMPPESPELIHSQDPSRKTDGKILSSTVFYDLLQKMADFAVIAGHPEDMGDYLQLAATMKEAYNRQMFDNEKAMYGNNTATANLLSLMLGLVPEGYEEKVFQNIVEKTEGDCKGHVSVGVLGIQQLMRGLTRYGREDIAYRFTTQDTYPSWGYMVKKGATTIWELWNGDTADPAMNSANHVMLLGDLLIWYYENLAGIKNAEGSNGFRHLEMKPCFPDGLNHVQAVYQSVSGEIKSEWTREKDKVDWQITVPANCMATVYLPYRFYTERPNQEGFVQVEKGADAWIVTIGSGTYRF